MRLTERSVSSSYRMALTVLLVLATSTVLGQPQPEAAPPAPPADPQLVDPATTAEAPVVEPDESASWLYNPNERTRFAIDALEAGAPKAAAEALDTALVLRGDDDPVAQYNAGTGRLLAGRTDAAPLLEAAAELVPETLGSRAHYNLGNARLAADDAQGAIDAYQRALRADPELADAKYNLELALKRLEQQQQEQQDQQQDGDGEQNDQQDQQQQSQNDDSEGDQDQDQQEQQGGDDQQEQNQGQDQQEQQDGEGQPPPPGEGEQQEQQQGPLPQFQDLPDMSAEEAAAILEAVENLEREQRRQEALEAMRANARGKKDW